MNICFFSFGHISKTKSGIDRVTDILSTAFTKKGYTVYMVSVCAPIGNDELTETQFQLPKLETNSEENKKFLKDFYATKEIDIIINQAEEKSLFDLIYDTHNDIPIISCIHCDPRGVLKGILDLWDECKLKSGWRFYLSFPMHYARALYRYYNRRKYISKKYKEYYEKSNAIVLLSDNFRKSFAKLAKIKNQNKLYAISNPNSFSVTETYYANKEKIVLYVGRLDFQKRVDRLLRIWKRVYSKNQEWKLQIVGEGINKISYEAISRKLKLHNVEFLGKRNPEEYYKKASVLCVTSSHEGLPMVILEALQYEVIPIAFNSFESVTDIITHEETGFIVDKFSEKKYSYTLTSLMKNEKYRIKIRNNISASNKTRKLDIDKIIGKWENLFKCLRSTQ
jgi:glycosyltransferase involved in cell wall biosynthesis